MTRREGRQRGIMGDRRGRVKSRNVYKGPMNKNNRGGRTECGRWGVSRAEESNGGKMGKNVIQQQ